VATGTRNVGVSAFVLVVIGSIGLFDLAQRPRFASIHTVDVIQLIATGMCYGVALALLGLVRKKSAE